MKFTLRPIHIAALVVLMGTIVVVVAVVASSGGGSDAPSPQVVAATSTAPPPTALPPTPTPVPPSPTPPPPPEPTEPAVRTNCAQITATGYQSDAERTWFLANCTGPSAQRPAATSAPGGQPAATARPSGPTPEEITYRSQASAQLGFLASRLAQYYGTPSLGGYNDILELGAIALNFSNAMNGLPPVPPRFRSVHDELRSSMLLLNAHCGTITSVTTTAALNNWVRTFNTIAARTNAAIINYNLVVGTNLTTLRR